MKCCYCHRNKDVKYIMPLMSYGFCSKVCIANNAIKHFKMKVIS